MRLAIIFGAYGAVGGDAALSAEISKSQCWMSYPSTAIAGSWPPSEPESGRCANRYPSLAEALAACEHRQPQCQGVVRDAGILCSVLGSGNGSTSPLGVRMRYTFETRCCGTALRSIGATLWLPSPLPEKGTPHGGCLSVNEWAEDRGWLEAATCPTPATAAVAADVSAGVVSERMAADLLDRAMSVDTIVRRSREQVAAVDAAEAAGGRCPALSAAATDGASSSRRCPSRSSFAEQLSLMPNEPLGDCGRSSLSICAFGHRGKADGWGAQHARRAGLFVVAEQLGCAYTHQPLVGMNSHSREHGVDEIRAERFFGLGSGCVAAKRVHASEAPCIQPFGDTPVHVMPLAITHHAAASCNGTVIERYRSWKRTLSRLMVHCDDPPAVAPWSRCAWLRAVAALRRRYFAAHSGPPELRWFTEAAAEVAGVGSHSDRRRANHTGRQPLHVHAPLHLHIAVHVRRGDLHVMDHSRMIPNKAWTSALEAVSSAVAEARAHRHAHRDRVLYPSIHLISDGDLKYKSDQEALPLALEKWRRTVERHNISFYAHINEDVFETMHHMIGADVLVRSISGFSTVAAYYSAGIPLEFARSTASPTDVHGGWSLGGLKGEDHAEVVLGWRDGASRKRFMCALHAHLNWKQNAKTVPQAECGNAETCGNVVAPPQGGGYGPGSVDTGSDRSGALDQAANEMLTPKRTSTFGKGGSFLSRYTAGRRKNPHPG